INADGDYSRVYYASGGCDMVRQTMKAWESILPPGDFLRIHRAHIINIGHVTTTSQSEGEFAVTLRGDYPRCTVSRRRVKEVLNQLPDQATD
ncbi:LytTR family transcriptional regulator, partial [Ruficoccus amylovorans]